MASLIPSANASGTGSMTLAGPSTNSNQTVNIPDTTGTMMVSGNMPAFSAYGTAFQSVASSTFAKIAFNTKDFDTNSYYDATTNYRFQPLIAGYYQINATISAGTSVTGAVQVAVYKNGSIYCYGTNVPNANLGPNANVSVVLYCNGSSDYVEIYGYQTSGGSINLGSGNSTYKFSGAMVRAA